MLVGAMYRERLREKYHRDVVKFEAMTTLDLTVSDFPAGLFDCFQGNKVIKKNMFACWCAPVRWAADASTTGFMGFWLALILTSVFIPLIWIFGFVGRIHIREQFGMDKNPVGDCCGWFWCYCCSLVQESKFVDDGFRALSTQRAGSRTHALPIAQAPSPTTPAPKSPATATPGTAESSRADEGIDTSPPTVSHV